MSIWVQIQKPGYMSPILVFLYQDGGGGKITSEAVASKPGMSWQTRDPLSSKVESEDR